MSHAPMSDQEHQKRYVEAIGRARLEGANSFQSWFDRSKDVRQAMIDGYWDLASQILTPMVCRYLLDPEEKVALEIGYGGGRILQAACSYFKEVIGIDIHNEQDTVEAFLRQQGKSNFRLIKTSGRTIDVDSASIDFIYSFIVLQHLCSFDAFVSYVKETYRCLKPGGLAQLYFGRYSAQHAFYRLRYFLQGYREIPTAPVNHVSLVVRVAKARRLCRDIGLQVIDVGTSIKRVSSERRRIKGGQSYVTLFKE